MPFHGEWSREAAQALRVPPAWVEAAALVVMGAAAAWLAYRLVMRFALPLAQRTSTSADERVLRVVAAPLALSILAAALVGAAQLLVTEPRRALALDRALPTALVILWSIALARLLGAALLSRAQRVRGQQPARGALIIGRFTKVVVGVIAFLVIMSLWDVALTPLLASAGIAGIALALAAQDTLANLFAGIAVHADGLYELGDYVVLDPGTEQEIRGEVRDIGLRSTKLLTRDDVLVVIPNSLIANARVVNESGQGARYRIRIPLHVAHDSDLEATERLLLAAAAEHALVLPDPAPRARVRAFTESGVRIELLAWIHDPRDRGPVIHDVSKRVHAILREHGIRLGYPRREVRMS